jgi:hypothetical protein
MRKPLRLLALATVVAAAAAFPTVAEATANAPSGTHYKSGGPASCTVDGTTVTCGGTPSSDPYTLAGVGHTDATVTLSAVYTATVVCTNPGGNLSDSQHQGSFPTTTGPIPLTPSKNGNLTVDPLSVSAPTPDQFVAEQTCPNSGWTPSVQGPITLSSFTYTLVFDGFPGPYITITGP